MDLTSLFTIKEYCRKCNLRPSREKGQNFLVDRATLEKIVRAANLGPEDVVLEIGAGFGILTRELAKRAGRVIAVEVDRKIIPILKENTREFKNVQIITGDILQVVNKELPLENYGYKIVANLPYQITSAILRKFLENEPRPSEMVVMVQKEVAERVCAVPGEASLLSMSVQFFGRPAIAAIVPRKVFYPEPEVDSAILRITRIKNESIANIKRISQKDFFRVVKMGFSARRKQLHNNLSGGLRLEGEAVKRALVKLKLDPQARAQDLGVDDWVMLIKEIYRVRTTA